MDELLNSILNPTTITNFNNIGDFFLANKNRSSLMAAIRYAINKYYPIKSEVDNEIVYASPFHPQWFDDGVIVLESKQPFEGLLCLYKEGGGISYGVVNRDVKEGDSLEAKDFDFIDLKTTREYFENNRPPTENELELLVVELRGLLRANEHSESKYQELFTRYPWILGLQYSKLQRHTNLDDVNIPDFTGMRVGAGFRDIFEIKPPTMKVFLANGNFSAEFNNAWNQAERYLNFAREEKDYLRRKGLSFDSPKCFLVCGYELPDESMRKIRVKERLNPAITLLTYNDILAFMENTVRFIKQNFQ